MIVTASGDVQQRAEQDPEPLDPEGYPRFHGAQRGLDQLADLVVGIAAVVGQQQWLALLERQPVQGRAELAGEHRLERSLIGARARGRVVVGTARAGPAVRCVFSAHRIHSLVVDHGEQPGAEGTPGWGVARGLAPQHQEYLLYDVLGQTLIAADPPRQAVREEGVALMEEPHGVWITRGEPAEEVDVGWPV